MGPVLKEIERSVRLPSCAVRSAAVAVDSKRSGWRGGLHAGSRAEELTDFVAGAKNWQEPDTRTAEERDEPWCLSLPGGPVCTCWICCRTTRVSEKRLSIPSRMKLCASRMKASHTDTPDRKLRWQGRPVETLSPSFMQADDLCWTSALTLTQVFLPSTLLSPHRAPVTVRQKKEVFTKTRHPSPPSCLYKAGYPLLTY